VTIVAACGVEPVASPGRVLPGGVHPVDAETGGLRLEPFDGDGAAARRDPNVLFPLERLREIERRGAIGGCSDVHFVGSDDPRRLAPGRAAGAIADALADRRVDSVLCCGCGGGGAFLACVLAREIEDRGFSTVAVVGPLRAAQRLRPPRALFVPSRSTRLFGDPGEKALQSDILLFALRRLEAAQRPGDIARFTRRMGPTGARGPDD
jgi:D-proline reductase (dithiol) PrdB